MILCGDCLHARSAHIQMKDIFYCSICSKLCELVQYNTDHKPSGIICQDGIAIKVKGERT